MRLLVVADRIDQTIFEIRLGLPLRTLAAERGLSLRCATLLDCDDTLLDDADVLVLQRGVTSRAQALLQAMRRSGGHSIYEIDDLLTRPALHLMGHERALRQVAAVKRCVAAADVVSASTARLAAELQPLARRVAVLPNHAAPGAPQAGPLVPGAPLTLFFAASDHVACDPLLPALRQVLAERPGGLRLVAVGPAAYPLRDAGLPVEAHALMPRDAFLGFVAALPNPVAVIPLGATPFEACKSAIKFFDYAAAGVPTLCSAVPPYADVVADGVTGRLVGPTEADWRAALLGLLDQPQTAAAWAQQAQADVAARFSLQHTVAAWAALLDSLGPRRHAPPPPPWWSRLKRRVRQAQRWNRARLAARKARKG